MLLAYFTIEKDIDITYTIKQAKKRFGCEFFISNLPRNIGPYKKVIKLYKKNDIVDFVKIEGPSEVIDKMYFLYSKETSL